MLLEKKLTLARNLAADDVGTAYEKGDHHMICGLAEQHLATKFLLMKDEELLSQVNERAPYLLEE